MQPPLSCLHFVRLALLCTQVVAVLALWVERQAYGLHLLLQSLLALPAMLLCLPAVLHHLLPNRRPKNSLHQHQKQQPQRLAVRAHISTHR